MIATDGFAGGLTSVPGEPVSPLPLVNAPSVPATLKVEIVGGGSSLLPMPAALSKVAVVEAPKLTPVTFSPVELKMFTSSPLPLRPPAPS